MARIDHAKLNRKLNTAPPPKAKTSKVTPLSKASELQFTETITDTGSVKIQCRVDADPGEYVYLLSEFLKKKKHGELYWPTLYFGTKASREKKYAEYRKEETGKYIEVAPTENSVITDDDLPFIL